MAIALKPGMRLRSAVDEVEVIVVKAPGDPVELCSGGHPMAAPDAAGEGGLSALPGFDTGTLLGKRYTDAAATVEVLCAKGGASTLSLGDEPLHVKDSKPLPASD